MTGDTLGLILKGNKLKLLKIGIASDNSKKKCSFSKDLRIV